tara:strand:+ start:1689 stop:1934 length:246 start_codon:yes stop_codon:yes gene_type:complete
MSDDLKTWNAALADAGDVLRGQLKDANDKIKELEADNAKLREANTELQGKVALLERDLKLARGHIDLDCTGWGDEKKGGGA